MSSTRQMRHAAQLLSRSLLLRAAVNRERQSSTLELIMPVVAPRKRLLCRLNVRHKWVRRLNPDREVYMQLQALRQGSLRRRAIYLAESRR
jgi:hypothetical protein